jgi:uncharacterized protein YraI
MKQQLVILTLLVVFVLSVGGFAAAQDNLLLNPGFEDERTTSVAVDPDAAGISFNAPVGWGGNVPIPTVSGADYPVGFPHRVFKRSGTFGFQMGRGGAIYTASLFQRVESVLSGLEVEAGAASYAEGDTGMTRIGIHPAGITNPFDPGTVWSDFNTERNTWRDLRVTTTATGTAVTVFLWGSSDAPANPNAAYFDDAFLRVIGGEAVAPPPSEDPAAVAGDPAAGAAPGVAAPPPGIPVPQPGDLINVIIPYGNLNVRSGAGTSFGKIGLISSPDAYQLLSEVENWYQINYNGQIGFVFAPLAQVQQQRVPDSTGAVPPPADTAGDTTGGDTTAPAAAPVDPGLPPNTGVIFIASPGSVAIFGGPDENFGRIGELPAGEFVHVTGRSPSVWLRVTFNGQSGWVIPRFGVIQGDQGAVPLVD